MKKDILTPIAIISGALLLSVLVAMVAITSGVQARGVKTLGWVHSLEITNGSPLSVRVGDEAVPSGGTIPWPDGQEVVHISWMAIPITSLDKGDLK